MEVQNARINQQNKQNALPNQLDSRIAHWQFDLICPENLTRQSAGELRIGEARDVLHAQAESAGNRHRGRR